MADTRPPATASKPPQVRYPSLRTGILEPQRNGSVRSTMAQPQRSSSSRTSASVKSPSIRTTGNVLRRPTNGLHRQETIRTRYMDMLLQLDLVPRMHNILSSFFGWLVLAGFVVFPGTFTSIEKLTTTSATANAILGRLQNLPLLIVAAVACGLGALGLLWLTVRWRRNYIWLLNRIFLPSTTNAVAGLISTLVSVYTQNNGEWSLMAKVTCAVEAGDLIICGSLFVISTLMLTWVKRKHRKEIGRFEEQRGEDEGILDMAERKWNEPAAAQQSVV
ncbi:hypothetical protein N0V82_004621 [Gnomoniopsis sp. IMI 355080]|nr:hypothetical protein N0V82_004621 [Gnomoniopsis sp. IMI 355080]